MLGEKLMAGEIITTQELIDAKVDAKDLGEAVNEDKVITPRYGDSYKSLPMAMRELSDAINIASGAGAGANGWTAQLVLDASGKTQQEINDDLTQKFDNHDVDINVIRKLATTPSHTSIKHYRKNGLIYDVITGILPWQLHLQSNREDSNSPDMTAMTAREFTEKYSKPVAVTAAGFKNADGTSGFSNDLLITNGIHIENGEVILDWATNPSSTQAICLMKDGKLKRFDKSEATAQEMVDEGAIWGQSWGGIWMIQDGVKLYTGTATSISARTILFQLSDDTLGFVLVEGKTGNYGATVDQAADIAFELGAVSAYNLDGGGSSQAYWGDTYAVPSTDSATRKIASCLLVSTPSVLPYKSGVIEHPLNPLLGTTASSPNYPALCYEQIGNEVSMYLNVGDSLLAHGDLTTVSDTRLSARYWSDVSIFSRALCLGGGSRPFSLFQSATLGTFSVSLLNLEPSSETPAPSPPTALWGTLSWRLNKD